MSEFKTINIKGKDYVEVSERIKAFRNNFKGFSLETEIIDITSDSCTMRAVIKDENGRTIATGTAHEEKNKSLINKTSYIENCETSAWGRALGNFGIGIDTAICSADELLNAIANQRTEERQGKGEKVVEDATENFANNLENVEPIITAVTLKKLTEILEVIGKPQEQIAKSYKVKTLKEMTEKQGRHALGLCEEYKRKRQC